MGELNGKVAIVTGAGRLRGIGRAAAVALAKLGADIVITGTGRNPETSTRVITGMLKQSQNLTNLAAFSDASISKTPALIIGCWATMPTDFPFILASPIMIFSANFSCTSIFYGIRLNNSECYIFHFLPKSIF